MNLPKHIAVIMDGNGRWAKQRGLSRKEGHLAGADAVHALVIACAKRQIPYLTLYAFSTENWNRPKEEVTYLFELFKKFVDKELPTLEKEGIRLRMIGDQENLPFATQKSLAYAIKRLDKGDKLTLTLALNYSARDEILNATRSLIREILQEKKQLSKQVGGYFNELELEEKIQNITQDTFQKHLYAPQLPDPDLIIRTSGELRLSNFLLYQAAYSELYFTDVLWPDFKDQDLEKALQSYANRKRRFGLIDEQVDGK